MDKSLLVFRFELVSFTSVIPENTTKALCERTIAELRGLVHARSAFGISEEAFTEAVRRLEHDELTPNGILLSRTDTPDRGAIFTLTVNDGVSAIFECPGEVYSPSPG